MRYLAVSRVLRMVHGALRKPNTPVFRPDLVTAPESRRAISISPHPDDDILAVGGTLRGHIEAGERVVSVVLTDGIRGTSDGREAPGLPGKRVQETRAAAEIIGISEIQFWSLPDGKLKADAPAITRLAELIAKESPDVVYAPFPVDYHFDHLAALEIAVAAMELLPSPPIIRCYECILPLIPNLLSDVTGTMAIKREAVACFHTQNAVSDYDHTVLEGLNRLRTHGILKGQGYAEGLFETDHIFLNRILGVLGP